MSTPCKSSSSTSNVFHRNLVTQAARSFRRGEQRFELLIPYNAYHLLQAFVSTFIFKLVKDSHDTYDGMRKIADRIVKRCHRLLPRLDSEIYLSLDGQRQELEHLSQQNIPQADHGLQRTMYSDVRFRLCVASRSSSKSLIIWTVLQAQPNSRQFC